MVQNQHTVTNMTLQDTYDKINELDGQIFDLEKEKRNLQEYMVNELATELGVKIGDTVKIADALNKTVIIERFQLGISRNWRNAQDFKGMMSENEYNELTKRKFALYAYAWNTKKDGSKDQRIKPEYNKVCLEEYTKVEG